MNRLALAVTICIFLFGARVPADFLAEQKKFARVREAEKDKQTYLIDKLGAYQMSINHLNLIFVAYKDDDLLEVYAKNVNGKSFKKVLSYNICMRSGQLGPKQKEGDRQVPEGFYYIDRFNPTSDFYLSLGLNYPNAADKGRSKAKRLGGDIFIHGSCVTVGCLPLTDSFIKEVYMLAVYARNSGQSHIPVYIFPFRMTDQRMSEYTPRYKGNTELIDFWNNLKTGYDNFVRNKKELAYTAAVNGKYIY